MTRAEHNVLRALAECRAERSVPQLVEATGHVRQTVSITLNKLAARGYAKPNAAAFGRCWGITVEGYARHLEVCS